MPNSFHNGNRLMLCVLVRGMLLHHLVPLKNTAVYNCSVNANFSFPHITFD